MARIPGGGSREKGCSGPWGIGLEPRGPADKSGARAKAVGREELAVLCTVEAGLLMVQRRSTWTAGKRAKGTAASLRC